MEVNTQGVGSTGGAVVLSQSSLENHPMPNLAQEQGFSSMQAPAVRTVNVPLPNRLHFMAYLFINSPNELGRAQGGSCTRRR